MAEPGLLLRKCPTGALIQLAGWRDDFASAAQPILGRLGFAGIGDFTHAQAAGEALCFRIAPERLLLRLASPAAWQAVADAVDPALTPFLDLSHARTVFRIEGADAAHLLARLLPIDFGDDSFGLDRFVQSSIHSVAVLVHRRADSGAVRVFELHVPSTFAASIREFIAESATPFGCRVEE